MIIDYYHYLLLNIIYEQAGPADNWALHYRYIFLYDTYIYLYTWFMAAGITLNK